MEKIMKIKLDKKKNDLGMVVAFFGEQVINIDFLENEEYYQTVAKVLGREAALKLKEVYEDLSNQDKQYNLVLLTDEELKGLEAKTKK